MRLLRKFWKSVKRNPVILATLASMALQFIQDYDSGAITTDNLFKYLTTLGLGFLAREFVVPLKEHNEALVSASARSDETDGSTL